MRISLATEESEGVPEAEAIKVLPNRAARGGSRPISQMLERSSGIYGELWDTATGTVARASEFEWARGSKDGRVRLDIAVEGGGGKSAAEGYSVST